MSPSTFKRIAKNIEHNFILQVNNNKIQSFQVFLHKFKDSNA
uniref:Uncharacterized protein n=1 Tax=Anguilla anguilla TaxID=7936 RepID=A0A0E9QSG5_ANGAN